MSSSSGNPPPLPSPLPPPSAHQEGDDSESSSDEADKPRRKTLQDSLNDIDWRELASKAGRAAISLFKKHPTRYTLISRHITFVSLALCSIFSCAYRVLLARFRDHEGMCIIGPIYISHPISISLTKTLTRTSWPRALRPPKLFQWKDILVWNVATDWWRSKQQNELLGVLFFFQYCPRGVCEQGVSNHELKLDGRR